MYFLKLGHRISSLKDIRFITNKIAQLYFKLDYAKIFTNILIGLCYKIIII